MSTTTTITSDTFIDEDEEREAEAKKRKKIRRVDIEWTGSKVQLPVGMGVAEAIKALEKKRDQDEQKVDFSHVIKAFPTDGAVALQKALRQKYGWVNLEPTMGWFGPEPPELIPVDIAYNEAIQVPWGNFTVPNITGRLRTGYAMKDGLPQFRLSATIRRADEPIFQEIAELTKEIVAQESIYKGQAVKLSFRDTDGDPIDFSPHFCPKFMDLKSFDPTELVLPQTAADGVDINLWTPIRHSEFCRRQNMPLKRGVLLEGGFGTGKTLTAFQTAQICVDNGWTFILLDDVRDIHQALGFARYYEPCVVFAEDVDKAVAGSRSNEVNQIFNTIDGIESKGHEVMTVLTTNLVGEINPGFIRPGRIDAVVTVGPPDGPAICKLVRRYSQDINGKSLLDESLSDQEIEESMGPIFGANAAFIREVVERSKLAAVAHADGAITIKKDDLAAAANSMEVHLNLVCPKRAEDMRDPLHEAFEAVGQKLSEKFIETIADPTVVKRVANAAKKKFAPQG